MKVRRCTHVLLEPRETSKFDITDLLSGGCGVVPEREWYALAPHLEAPLRMDEAHISWLGKFSASEWLEPPEGIPSTVLDWFLERGLLFTAGAKGGAAEADDRLRALHWWPAAAVAHWASRWHAVDSVASMQRLGTDSIPGLVASFGPPPSAVMDRPGAAPDLVLDRAEPAVLDELLARRVTCRNFDAARPLPRWMLSSVLERVFSAREVRKIQPGVEFLKKYTPSGGGLHATEAYLLVRHVTDVAPGLYHYRPREHALRPLPCGVPDLEDLAGRALAGQHWFADAPVLVIYAPRIERSHWKYRNHPKAYRALLLDIGHLSQTLYMSATELGLGAFVTAAINEGVIEDAFGLEGMSDGPLAVGGFGWRAQKQRIAEFDPAGSVWGGSESA